MLKRNLAQSFLNSIPNWTSLTKLPQYYVRVRFPNKRSQDFTDCRVEYKKLVKAARLKNISEYWERQTQLENEFIGKRQQNEIYF